MNKNLIGLAVALVAGSAMAQASLTGNVTYGYKQTTSAPGALASGLGVDTAEVYLGSKEDLGGGHSAEAKLGLSDTTRAGTTGGDVELKYTNPSVGLFSMGYTKASDYFAGVASAGAPIIDMDGKLHETRSNGSEWVAYAVPVGPVFLQFKHSENSAGKGLGAGAAGQASTISQRNNQLSVYMPGKLTIAGGWVVYDNRQNGDPASGAAADSGGYIAATKSQVVNLQASYDLGVATIGAGAQQADATNGVRVLDGIVSVSIPVGAWTLGVASSISTLSGAQDVCLFAGACNLASWKASQYNGTATGLTFGAKYALSKRTSFSVKTATWTHSGYSQYEADAAIAVKNGNAFNGAQGKAGLNYGRTASETSLLLSHDF